MMSQAKLRPDQPLYLVVTICNDGCRIAVKLEVQVPSGPWFGVLGCLHGRQQGDSGPAIAAQAIELH